MYKKYIMYINFNTDLPRPLTLTCSDLCALCDLTYSCGYLIGQFSGSVMITGRLEIQMTLISKQSRGSNLS